MIFQKQIEKIYKSNIFVRNDNQYGIFYFGPDDFPGLKSHAYCFKARAGHDLKGYFYHYDNPIPGRLVVFDHGMGNGHRAYMREIEMLCKAGFLVYSYDHTGCMASGGENCGGFAQSLSDLDCCLTALKQEETLKDYRISVMGHSWGGFSTMNIAALHPEITHVVSMSGFVSVQLMLEQSFTGLLKGYRGGIMELERQANSDYADFDARKSLKNTNAKVLLIYSADDQIVHNNVHFNALLKAVGSSKNVRFLLVRAKNHNPSYDADAVAYKDAFFAEYTKAAKKKLLEAPAQQQEFMSRYDWHRMTEQDDEVWNEIISHLKTE